MTSAETLPVDPTSSQPKLRTDRRVMWVVASRGDILLLGPLFKEFKKRQQRGLHHWLQDTGEVGMAAIQARDWLGLIPDETGDLCHPADEPAIRLGEMITRTESFIRRHKGTHVVFSGFGPTAAATAIYCHARGCKGLWLRPPDPAGLVAHLRWEAGLERMIRAAAPCVETWQVPGVPDWKSLEKPDAALPLEREIPGLRPGAPVVLIAVLRRDWGYLDDGTTRVARAAAAWAAAHPGVDVLIVSNLNARLEGPVRALDGRPANLLLAPPLPYPLYRAALERARLVLTDSPLIAAESFSLGCPVATLGDLSPVGEASAPGWHRALRPADLQGPAWLAELAALLSGEGSVRSAAPAGDVYAALRATLEQWLA